MTRFSRRFSGAPLSLAFAAAAALPCGAQAQSSVNVYGLVDVSVGSFQDAHLPGVKAVKKVESGNMATTFIGFGGKEDLGGGLKATFQLESFLLADTGQAGRFSGDKFWARNANVGLTGGFGSIKAGRTAPPLFISTLLFNAFSDSFGYSPVIRQWYLGALRGDSGWSNAVRYDSPSIGGTTFTLMGNAGEGEPGATGGNLGANVIYFGGPLGLTAAWQKVKNNNGNGGLPAGFDNQASYQLGASYDLTAVKLFAQYGQVKNNITAADSKAKISSGGASIPLGGGAVLLEYSQAKYSGAISKTSKTFTGGYDYNLSKRTDIYAIYLNDRATNLSSGNTFAVGMRHNF